MKTCKESLERNAKYISTLADDDILSGIARHGSRSWWQQDYVKKENQAYLRRWGALLRREARRRELL